MRVQKWYANYDSDIAANHVTLHFQKPGGHELDLIEIDFTDAFRLLEDLQRLTVTYALAYRSDIEERRGRSGAKKGT